MQRCECCDRGCREHEGENVCYAAARTMVYQTDIEDETGTFMCIHCADAALESGVFTIED